MNEFFANNWLVMLITLIGIFVFIIGAKSFLGIVFIPEDKSGIITKKFGLGKGSDLPDGRVISTKGESGVQAKMLPPGLKFGYFPWQYSIEKVSFFEVRQGYIGTVESKDGNPMPEGMLLAPTVESNNFQDAEMFLDKGGYKGPQRNYLMAGKYRINTKLFLVQETPLLEVAEGHVGIVTTLDGKPLPEGHIAGRCSVNHESFQNADSFLSAEDGYRGLQEGVLMAGKWRIHPLFAKVEDVPMAVVEVGFCGVIVSYVGGDGIDLSGDKFTHGRIVEKGCKGVWSTTLDPGKYPINPKIHKVHLVPTTNIVLNWADAVSEAHTLDKELSTIKLRGKDGFAFSMDVAQIINIANTNAPKVIARFGSIQNLVSQVLEPTIQNYFRNSAQKSGVIDFIQARETRQSEAKTSTSKVLQEYDVEAVDTLIGDIVPPKELMDVLTARKIAEEQKETFDMQEQAQIQKQKLATATANAEIEGEVTKSNRKVEIAEKDADAAVKTATGKSQARKLEGQGEADYLNLTSEAKGKSITNIGTAEAEIILKKGTNEAEVMKKKIDAVGSENYTSMQLISSISDAKLQLVPQIVSGGAAGSNVESLLGIMTLKALGVRLPDVQIPLKAPEIKSDVVAEEIKTDVKPLEKVDETQTSASEEAEQK